MKTADLSVIIPVGYRHALVVGGAVSSCLSNTLKPAEILVVDDCACPCVDLPEAPPSVQVIRLDEHCGRSATRNAGIRAATRQWVFFVDADDRVDAQTFEVFQQERSRHPAADLIWAPISPHGVRGPIPWHIGIFVLREHALAVGFDPKMSCGEDADFFLRLTAPAWFVVHRHSRPYLQVGLGQHSTPHDERERERVRHLISLRQREGYYQSWLTR